MANCEYCGERLREDECVLCKAKDRYLLGDRLPIGNLFPSEAHELKILAVYVMLFYIGLAVAGVAAARFFLTN